MPELIITPLSCLCCVFLVLFSFISVPSLASFFEIFLFFPFPLPFASYYFPTDTAPYMVRWVTNNRDLTEYTVDETTGAEKGLNYEDTNSDSSVAAWYLAANTADQASAGWTAPYLFYGNVRNMNAHGGKPRRG